MFNFIAGLGLSVQRWYSIPMCSHSKACRALRSKSCYSRRTGINIYFSYELCSRYFSFYCRNLSIFIYRPGINIDSTTVLRHVILGCDAIQFGKQIRKNMLFPFLHFQSRVSSGTFLAFSPCLSVKNIPTFMPLTF